MMDEIIYCYCYGGGFCKLVLLNLLFDEFWFWLFGKEIFLLVRVLIEDKNYNIWIGLEMDIILFDVYDQIFEFFGEIFFNCFFNYSECFLVIDR